MSNRRDDINNRKLKELLDQKGADNPSLDDFEKEALEGFAMLDSLEDAFDQKDKLDARIYQKVFAEEKKSRRGTYWFAAAGLFLVIGFSIYFIRDSGLDKKEVAVQQDVSGISEQEPKAPAELDLKVPAPEDKKETFKDQGTLHENQDALTVSSKETESPAQPKKAITFSDDVDNNSTSGESVQVGFASQEMSAVAVNTAAKPASAPDPKEEEDLSEDLKKQPVEEKAKEERLADKEVIISSEVATKNKKALKKSDRSKGSMSPAATVNPAGGAFDSTIAFYTGGEEALMKDLKALLEPKNLLFKFDATLFINEKKEVETAIFTEYSALNRSRQKEVLEVLKKLNKFSSGGTAKTPLQYKLVFRP